MPNHAEQLAQELNLNVKNVQGAIELIDQGNTIPFIARYRKEATGSMDDQVLRDLGDRLEYLRGLDKRKDEVTSSITEQSAMTPELTAALSKAKTLADANRASHYVQSEAVLKHLEKGKDLREIASQFGLSAELLATWHASAIELGNLVTQKARSRLIPRNRQRQLLPAELGTTAEKHALADVLKVCQAMRKRPKQMAEFRWAIRYCLTNSNSSHAGIKFTSPKIFRRFMTFVSKLYPWSQWRLDLHVPQDKPAKRWHLHPALAVERSTLRKVQQFPQGYAYLYLNHPKEELCQAGHSSPMLRYLFHRFAIILPDYP